MLPAAYTRIHLFDMAYSGHEARKCPAATRYGRRISVDDGPKTA
jgi:hypothetical protein